MEENEENEEYLEFEEEKRKIKRNAIMITIILVIVAMVASSEFTLMYYANKFAPYVDKAEASEDTKTNLRRISTSLENFRALIDEVYRGDIDEQKVMDETIKGYVNGLGDEYSEYFTKEEWEDFQTNALGNYVGIGVYMGVDKQGNTVVISPIKGTPAEEAGLESGDIFVQVNDESVLGLSSDVISQKVKGEEGTKVRLTMARGNEYKEFEIERKAIKIYHVESEMLEGNIGHIILSTFDEGCAQEVYDEYLRLKALGAKKYIIDLRNNTGGLVEEALNIIDLCVPKGKTILITKDSKDRETITTSKSEQLITEPIVILENEYSASASEILTGALRDLLESKVVGTTSFGKGVIQSVYSLKDGSALKITISEYFTPNKDTINKVGIKPDYEIEDDEETEEDEQLNKAIELLK